MTILGKKIGDYFTEDNWTKYYSYRFEYIFQDLFFLV